MKTVIWKMKKKEIIVIIVLLIMVIIMGILYFKNNNKQSLEVNTEETDIYSKEEYEENKDSVDMPGIENVEIDENGDIINISTSLKEFKEIDGCTIEVISAIYDNTTQTTVISIKAINEKSKLIDMGFVTINIKTSEGEIFESISTYIGEIEGEDYKKVTISTPKDIVNMYDITIEK